MSIKYGVIDIIDLPDIAKVYHERALVYKKHNISWETIKEDQLFKTIKAIVPINQTIYIELTGKLNPVIKDIDGKIESNVYNKYPRVIEIYAKNEEITMQVFKSIDIVKISTRPPIKLIDEINPVEKEVAIITEEIKNEAMAWGVYEDLQNESHIVVVNRGDKIKAISTTEGKFEAKLEDTGTGVSNSIGKDVKELEFDMLDPEQGVLITNNDLGVTDLGLEIYKIN